jgi:hypothetical protein
MATLARHVERGGGGWVVNRASSQILGANVCQVRRLERPAYSQSQLRVNHILY